MTVAENQHGPATSESRIPEATESFWAHWAEARPSWSPPHYPLLVVAPHPDDETLGAGGLLSAWAERGLPVTLLSVTDGEAACPELPGLAETRRVELTSALRELGFGRPHVIRLQLPDGGLAAHEQRIAVTITQHLQPDWLLVAPFELDGHADHDVVGRAAQAAARARAATLARYVIWAWQWNGPRLLAAERTAVRFGLTDRWLAAKRQAIAQFRTQIGPRPGGHPVIPSEMHTHFTRPHEIFLL